MTRMAQMSPAWPVEVVAGWPGLETCIVKAEITDLG
jgi:hypothetical protein